MAVSILKPVEESRQEVRHQHRGDNLNNIPHNSDQWLSLPPLWQICNQPQPANKSYGACGNSVNR
jgi:hypothetical protein